MAAAQKTKSKPVKSEGDRVFVYIVLGALIVLGIGFARYWKKLKINETNEGGRDLIHAVVKAEKKFYGDKLRYSPNLADTGLTFSHTNPDYKTFLKKEEVPTSIRAYLEQNEVPFIEPDKFLILVSVHNKYNNQTYFWLANEKEEIWFVDKHLVL